MGEAGAAGEALLRLLASPNLRSKKFAFRQYDSTVQANTVVGPGGGAAVVRVEGTTQRPRPDHRLQSALHAPRSAPGRRPGRRRGRQEPRLRRSTAHRRHGLPELRQSRKAGRCLAVDRGHPRTGRGVSRPRRAHRQRQRQPVQRDRGPSHPAHANRRHGWPARRRRAGRFG